MVYVLLGTGFEETEAIAPIDLLRRAEIPTLTVALADKTVCGGHGIRVEADITIEEMDLTDMDMIVLPGGLGGVASIENSVKAMGLIQRQLLEGYPLAAICAAPSILGKRGWVEGKRVTCYPGFEEQMKGAVCVDAPAVVDGKLITGRSAGAAMDFALTIVEEFCGAEQRKTLADGIVWPY